MQLTIDFTQNNDITASDPQGVKTALTGLAANEIIKIVNEGIQTRNVNLLAGGRS